MLFRSYSATAYNPTYPNVRNDKGEWDEDLLASEVWNPLGLLDIDIHRSRADFRRPFQTGKQFGNGTVLIFRETALEDMGQNDFVGQEPAAGSIQGLFFLPRVQILGNSGRDFHGITIFL